MIVFVIVPRLLLKFESVENSKKTVPITVLRVHKTVEVWVVSPEATPFGKVELPDLINGVTSRPSVAPKLIKCSTPVISSRATAAATPGFFAR